MSLHGVFTRCLYTVSVHASCSEFLVLRTCQIDQLSSCLTDCLLFSWGFRLRLTPFWVGSAGQADSFCCFGLQATDFPDRLLQESESYELMLPDCGVTSCRKFSWNGWKHSPCHLCPKWLDITMPLGSLSYVIGSLVLFQLRVGSIGDHDSVIVSWMSSFHESNVRLAYSLSLFVLFVTRQGIAMHVFTFLSHGNAWRCTCALNELRRVTRQRIAMHVCTEWTWWLNSTSPEFIVWMAGFIFIHPGCVLSFQFSTPLVPGGNSTEFNRLRWPWVKPPNSISEHVHCCALPCDKKSKNDKKNRKR